MSERVSVVVVNYNGAEHLPHALGALAALRGPIDEVLVVDNASTDGSADRVAELLPSARVVRLATNGGPCAARNAGLRAARNRWVLALDNDAVPAPDVLEKLLAARDAAGPGVAVLQPRSVFFDDPERVHYDGGAFHYAGLIVLRNFYAPIERAVGAGVVEVDCAIAVLLLVDKDRLLELGGWDERYFILFEDLDLSYRLRARGLRILSVEDALVRHRGGTSGISFRDGPDYPRSRVFLHARNRRIFLARNLAPRTLAAARPGLALYDLASFAFALASGAGSEWRRGRAEARGLWSVLRAEEARERPSRTVGDARLLSGGPLVLTPAVARSAVKRLANVLLDAALRAWWTIGRRLA
ncbi:MAG: glycosyltransferase family 2 protein [Planctomycetes bacterium]|nr:glycosyltransferase family 2 protein [Planctomycetota bacterium]